MYETIHLTKNESMNTELNAYIDKICKKTHVVWIKHVSNLECEDEVNVNMKHHYFENCNSIAEVDNLMNKIIADKLINDVLFFEWGWY